MANGEVNWSDVSDLIEFYSSRRYEIEIQDQPLTLSTFFHDKKLKVSLSVIWSAIPKSVQKKRTSHHCRLFYVISVFYVGHNSDMFNHIQRFFIFLIFPGKIWPNRRWRKARSYCTDFLMVGLDQQDPWFQSFMTQCYIHFRTLSLFQNERWCKPFRHLKWACKV